MEEKFAASCKFLGPAAAGRPWQDFWIEVFPSTDTDRLQVWPLPLSRCEWLLA
jgi:hypothetical protein